MSENAESLDIQFHLENVSRSFAFCIARLESQLRHSVGLAYLLCRVLDTVEDSHWPQADANQAAAFDGFLEMLAILQRRDDEREALTLHALVGQASTWAQDVRRHTSGVNDGEVRLLGQTGALVAAIYALPESTRIELVPPVVSMALAMKNYAASAGQVDKRRLTLRSLSEVNHYCFFVAGVVGEILTGLVRQVAQDRGFETSISLLNGFRFGLFLQKVNLLKDRERDLAEGRDLVPDEGELRRSSLADAEAGFRYLLSLPPALKGYRLFCAWSLFLGLKSLEASRRREKLGRVETAAFLASVEAKLGSDVRLEKLFLELRQNVNENSIHELPAAAQVISSRRGLESYRRFYRGRAREDDLAMVANLDLEGS